MPDRKRISEFNQAVSMNDNMEFVVNNAGVTQKVDQSQIKSDIQDINSLGAKGSLVDADEFLINDSADSNNPKKITLNEINTVIKSFIDPGWISTKGLYIDGNNLKIYPYKINVAGTIYSSASAVTIVNLTTLDASSWYAVCVKESDGTWSVQKMTGNGVFDNYTIGTNDLNALSIYNSDYNYMRDSISSIWYRITNLIKIDTTPDNVDMDIPVPNRPLSYVYCETNAQQDMLHNTHNRI